MVQIPGLFQSAGWVLPTAAFALTAAWTCACALMLAREPTADHVRGDVPRGHARPSGEQHHVDVSRGQGPKERRADAVAPVLDEHSPGDDVACAFCALHQQIPGTVLHERPRARDGDDGDA
jgi:hypothetical protein